MKFGNRFPPKLFLRFFRWFLPSEAGEAYRRGFDGVIPRQVNIQQREYEPGHNVFFKNLQTDLSVLKGREIYNAYYSPVRFASEYSQFPKVFACLGTFGLISFTAERKTKEIGIRKVLGASVGNVTFMLIREFVILFFIAGIIAWPVTWYFINSWIEGFIYRTSVGPEPFVLATLLAAAIIVATIGFRAMKAAVANPVDSLRAE